MGRTRLTTPPGQEPQGPEREPDERYVPGLGLPSEPSVPGPHRRKVIAILLVVLVGVGGWVAWRAATAGQSFDPALSDLTPGEATEAPTSPVDPRPADQTPTTGATTP